MNKSIFTFILFLLLTIFSECQAEKYWVFFKDKNNVEFNPHEYFHPKAIERRIKLGLSINDVTDAPVNRDYMHAVALLSDSISYASRWFNALCIYAPLEHIGSIERLHFVDSIKEFVKNDHDKLCAVEEDSKSEVKQQQLLNAQINIMEGNHFIKNKINGKGIRIAVLDAGFPGVDKSESFKHLNIVDTWDFVQKHNDVYGHMFHGSAVLSCIGGKSKSQYIGLATGASYFLARTERGFLEPYSEEENWLAAVEWADKNGVDIINSSLGYTNTRYFVEQMDGKTSLISSAAKMASEKGILVINAAGNDGGSEWKFIGTPGDVEEVLTIGGINPYTNYHIDFSSFGPTADKRMKPNVCTYGETVADNGNKLTVVKGTSFSSPLIAGFAACVWQLFPDFSNKDIFNIIQKSAHLYPYFDYAHGYGIPQASYFYKEKKEPLPTLNVEETSNYIIVKIRDGAYDTSKDSDYLYYHLENSSGFLSYYKVVKLNSQYPLEIKKSNLTKGDVLRFHYKKHTLTYKY